MGDNTVEKKEKHIDNQSRRLSLRKESCSPVVYNYIKCTEAWGSANKDRLQDRQGRVGKTDRKGMDTKTKP